jgi:hypothetical protein
MVNLTRKPKVTLSILCIFLYEGDLVDLSTVLHDPTTVRMPHD